MLRILPSELLGDFEAHGLRALSVVGPQVDVDEPPAVSIADLRAESIHIVVIARDRENRGAINRRSEHLARFQVVWNEDAALHAETRRVRGHAVGEVSGRRTREDVETE